MSCNYWEGARMGTPCYGCGTCHREIMNRVRWSHNWFIARVQRAYGCTYIPISWLGDCILAKRMGPPA